MRRLTGWHFGQILGASFMVLGGILAYKGIAKSDNDYLTDAERPVSDYQKRENSANRMDGIALGISGLALLLSSSYRGDRRLKRRKADAQTENDEEDNNDSL